MVLGGKQVREKQHKGIVAQFLHCATLGLCVGL